MRAVMINYKTMRSFQRGLWSVRVSLAHGTKVLCSVRGFVQYLCERILMHLGMRLKEGSVVNHCVGQRLTTIMACIRSGGIHSKWSALAGVSI